MLYQTGFLSLRPVTSPALQRSLSQDQKSVQQPKIPTPTQPASAAGSINPNLNINYTTTNFDKRLLSLTGFYPSFKEVPHNVPSSQMEKCRNIIRVRGLFVMMGFSVIGALIASFQGKSEAHRITTAVNKAHQERDEQSKSK